MYFIPLSAILAWVAVVGTISGFLNGISVDNFTTAANTIGSKGGTLASAVVATAFAYEGWIVAITINSEIKNSKKNLPKALAIGGTAMACGCQSNVTFPLELTKIIQHNKETLSFDFVSVLPLHWYEGDSSKLFLEINGQSMSRKFSYATLPEENIIRFTTRIRDERSRYKDRLSKLTIGEIIDVSGPDGSFELKRNHRPALLLSNGVGIATMRSLIKTFIRDNSNVDKLTQVNVDRSGEIYKDEFEVLSNQDEGFTSVYVKSHNEFYKQIDYEYQQLMVNTGKIPNIYIVGSDNFIVDINSYMMSLGLSPNDIYTDGPIKIGSDGSCGCSSGGSCGCDCA